MSEIVIRPGCLKDASFLPLIEISSGASFRDIASLAWLADDKVVSEDEHRVFILQGRSWVAEHSQKGAVGFIVVTRNETEIHICQLAVAYEYQRRGIGKQLMETVSVWARKEKGVKAITLTTFENVPWNAPFYRGLGYQTVPQAELSPHLKRCLQQEKMFETPDYKRCAMRLGLH